MWCKKEVHISPFVQALLDTFNESPDRFDIEYCLKDGKHTHIQLRDVEEGYSKGSWIYINSGGNWYTSLHIGGQRVANNLAQALTDDEIDAIYKTVKARSTLLRSEEKYSLLEKYLGKYKELCK